MVPDPFLQFPKTTKMQHPSHAKCQDEIRDAHTQTKPLMASHTDAKPLSVDAIIIPSDSDVVCCKGKLSMYHKGNMRLKRIVYCHVEQYKEARSKSEKSRVVSRVLAAVCNEGCKARFIRQDPVNGFWMLATSRFAREKIGQLFRNVLHTQYKSSTAAKKRRREARHASYDACFMAVVRSNARVNSALDHLSNRLSAVRTMNFVSDREPEVDVETMFAETNCRILEILKASKAAETVSSMLSRLGDGSTKDDSCPVE